MRTQAQKDFVQELKAKAKIEIFDDKLSNVQIDTSASAGEGEGAHGGHMPPAPGHPAQTMPGAIAAPEATPETP